MSFDNIVLNKFALEDKINFKVTLTKKLKKRKEKYFPNRTKNKFIKNSEKNFIYREEDFPKLEI